MVMQKSDKITTLFLDIGGVLLTNGWDRYARRAAAEKFDLEFDEFDERHHLTYDIYEQGKLTLDQYLDRVLFFRERKFTREDFKRFMYARSQPLPEMLDFIRALITKRGLQAVAVSNEGKELTEHRIATFNLAPMFHAFISSCYVHYRKPDLDIFRVALGASQAQPGEVLYIDDRAMFVEVAATLGIRGIVHEDFESTRDKLTEFGLSL